MTPLAAYCWAIYDELILHSCLYDMPLLNGGKMSFLICYFEMHIYFFSSIYSTRFKECFFLLLFLIGKKKVKKSAEIKRNLSSCAVEFLASSLDALMLIRLCNGKKCVFKPWDVTQFCRDFKMFSNHTHAINAITNLERNKHKQ